jgi:hypothetical protein
MIGRIALPNETVAELSTASLMDDPEACRIAGELLKLHRDRAIWSAADRDALFYACLIRDFGATYSGIASECGQAPIEDNDVC